MNYKDDKNNNFGKKNYNFQPKIILVMIYIKKF